MPTKQYEELWKRAPRRTNECWLGDLEAGKEVYVCGHKFLMHLEGTALRIWQLLDGSRSIEEIVGILASEYHADSRDVILKDTIDYMLQLERAGLAAWRSRPLFEDVELDD